MLVVWQYILKTAIFFQPDLKRYWIFFVDRRTNYTSFAMVIINAGGLAVAISDSECRAVLHASACGHRGRPNVILCENTFTSISVVYRCINIAITWLITSKLQIWNGPWQKNNYQPINIRYSKFYPIKWRQTMNIYWPIRALQYHVEIPFINALYKDELYKDAHPEIRTCFNIQTMPSSTILRGLVVSNKWHSMTSFISVLCNFFAKFTNFSQQYHESIPIFSK